MWIRIDSQYGGGTGLRNVGVLALLLAALATPAMAESDVFRSLDSVGGAEPSSLDAVSTSEPSSLDAVPTSQPSSLDAVPLSKPSELEALPAGSLRSPDDIPTAQPVNLDALPVAETEPPEFGAGRQLNSIAPHQREAFESAQKAMAVARARLDAANASYSNMMARNYPRGEAKAAIVAERDSARAAYAQASANFRDLGGEAPAAQDER